MTRRGVKGTKGGLVFRGFGAFSWFRVSESPADAEKGLVCDGETEDRGKAEDAEGAEGTESLNALRGVGPLKEVSVLSGFQWGQWFGGRAG